LCLYKTKTPCSIEQGVFNILKEKFIILLFQRFLRLQLVLPELVLQQQELQALQQLVFLQLLLHHQLV
jgi:hypothetical protein